MSLVKMKAVLYSTLLFPFISAASAASIQVDYTLDLGSGTLNRNALTNVLILEERSGLVNLDFSYSVPGAGEQILSHMAPFLPTSSLIIGLDQPSTSGGDEKTHLVFFTNNEFATNASGAQFSTVFPNVRHSDFINRLLLAEGGDSLQAAWLTNFFTGEGHSAAFATATQSTAIEFSSGSLLTPEPLSLGTVALGLVALISLRNRRNAPRR